MIPTYCMFSRHFHRQVRTERNMLVDNFWLVVCDRHLYMQEWHCCLYK